MKRAEPCAVETFPNEDITGFCGLRYENFRPAAAYLFFTLQGICGLRSKTAASSSALPADRLGNDLAFADHLDQPTLEHLAAGGEWKALHRNEELGHIVF